MAEEVSLYAMWVNDPPTYRGLVREMYAGRRRRFKENRGTQPELDGLVVKKLLMPFLWIFHWAGQEKVRREYEAGKKWKSRGFPAR